MAKWHISPQTRKPARCEAPQGGCPFGSEHYDTQGAANIAHFQQVTADLYEPTPVVTGAKTYNHCERCGTEDPSDLFHDRSRRLCNACANYDEMTKNTEIRRQRVVKDLEKKRDQLLKRPVSDDPAKRDAQLEQLNNLQSKIAEERMRLSAQGPSQLPFTNEEFNTWRKKQGGVCTYCGVSDAHLHKAKYVNMMSGAVAQKLGIDRRDNDGEYKLENMLLCCFGCNQMKSNIRTEDEMR